MSEVISTLFPLLFVVIVFWAVISRIKKDAKGAQKKSRAYPPMKLSVDSSFKDMEDKQHDWLAQQIAYEQSMKPKVDDMFALRKEHAASCDAKNVRTTL